MRHILRAAIYSVFVTVYASFPAEPIGPENDCGLHKGMQFSGWDQWRQVTNKPTRSIGHSNNWVGIFVDELAADTYLAAMSPYPQCARIVKPIFHGEVDVVLGSRFLGKTINIPAMRYLILKLGILFTYLYSGIILTDTYCGIRAFSRKALLKINLKQNKIEHASEILDNISRSNLKFKEVPVTILYNKYSLEKGEKNSRSFTIVLNLKLL